MEANSFEVDPSIIDTLCGSRGGKSDRRGGLNVFCPAHADGEKKGQRSLHISPGDDGKVLLHCLAGETRIVTRQGTKEISSLAGEVHELLTSGSGGSVWVESPITNFGVQPLMEITLERSGNTKTLFATPEHRWITERRSDSPLLVKTTQELTPGTRLKSLFRRRNCDTVSFAGVAHGFTYGDGHIQSNGYGAAADFIDGKDALLSYFPNMRVYEYDGGRRKRVVGLPKSFKSPPPIDEGLPYLLGYLAGYFSADGCVDKQGRATIASASRESLQSYRDIASVVGIGTYQIRSYDRVGINRKTSPVYQMTLRDSDLFSEFFVLPKHRERFDARSERKNHWDSWVVRDVQISGRNEEVFCATVPTTHTFTLEDNILTGNCFAGCTEEEICSAAGIKREDLFSDTKMGEARMNTGRAHQPTQGEVTRETAYEIRGEDGTLAAFHVRIDYGDGTKKFEWKRPDGKMGLGGRRVNMLPLYGMELLPLIRKDTKRLVLCEGEKAADALRSVGIKALSTLGASTTPDDSVLKRLSGLIVVLWPDNDDAGRDQMAIIGKRLSDLGVTVKLFTWADAGEKEDAADHPATRSRDKARVRELALALVNSHPFVPEYNAKTDGSGHISLTRSRFEEYIEAAISGEGMTGIPTKFSGLDKKMGGLRKGESIVVGAETRVGKSIFVGEIGVKVADEGYKVLLQSTEMSRLGYSRRFAHARAEVPFIQSSAYRLTRDQGQMLRAAHDDLEKMPLTIDDWNGDIDRIRRNIEKDEPDLVIIDHLHRMRTKNESNSKYRDVGNASRDITSLKTEYPICVLVAAQTSRAPAHRNDKRPLLSDLKDASDIEQDADIVLMLHRAGFYSEEVDKNDIDVFCRKYRDGETFDVKMYNVEHQAWFSEDMYEARGNRDQIRGVVTYW